MVVEDGDTRRDLILKNTVRVFTEVELDTGVVEPGESRIVEEPFCSSPVRGVRLFSDNAPESCSSGEHAGGSSCVGLLNTKCEDDVTRAGDLGWLGIGMPVTCLMKFAIAR